MKMLRIKIELWFEGLRNLWAIPTLKKGIQEYYAERAIIDRKLRELEETNITLNEKLNELYPDESEEYKDLYEDICEKYTELLEENEELLVKLKDIKSKRLNRVKAANKTGETVINVKHYPESDKRYVNIMSHMDILWHYGETGPDDCSKCNNYRNIMMSAFDKIERMSSSNISQDFSTKHINGDPDKIIDDNNNHIHANKLTGQIRGGDKTYDDMEFYGDES